MTSTTRPYMQYEIADEFVARWHGGAYIELGYVEHDATFHAHDVINVWDYAKDEPRIARTLAAFVERVEEFIAERDAEEEL